MATVVTRIGPDGRRRYDVRYRDPAGVQRKRSFLRRTDAAAYSAIVEADKLRGAYVDRNAGRELFRVYATVGWPLRSSRRTPGPWSPPG